MAKDFKVYGAKIEIGITDVKTILSALDKLQKTLNTISDIANAGFARVDSAARKAANSTDHLTDKTAEYEEITRRAMENIVIGAKQAQAQYDEMIKDTEKLAQAAKKLVDIRKQENDFLIALNQSQALIRSTDFKQEVSGIQAVTNGYKGMANAVSQVASGQLSVFQSAKALYSGTQGLLGGVSRLQEGLNIALADTSDQYNRIGKVALGLKTTLFGISGPTDKASKSMQFLAGVLDKVIDKNVSLSKAAGEYGAKAAQVAEQAAQYNRGLGDSLLALNRAAKIVGVDASSQIRRVAAAANEASNRFDEIRTTIEAGGKVNRALLSAQTKSVVQLKNAFHNLEVSGVVPTMDAIKKLGKEYAALSDKKSLEAQKLKLEIKGLIALRKQYLDLKKAIDINNQATKLIGVNLDAAIAGSKNALSKIKNFLFPVKKELNGTADSAKKTQAAFLQAGSGAEEFSKKVPLVTQSLQQAQKGMSIFRDVMLGTFAGGFLLNIFNSVTGFFGNILNSVKQFVAGLKQEFFQANNLVQNFEITLKQMLTGFDKQEVEKALKGANEFIREIIAKTPFELATGQASFQQLITGGLDPRQWLEPAADAAAAFNKPMEQLIFAIQRLKAGSKGIGVDMLRDFGIPVQQVGVYIDKVSGRVLEFNEVAGKTEEQLIASGAEFKRWAFDAQGSLEQTPTEAIEILNGYLKQNATIAGGAAARSRTLQGVMSNLNDAVTTLLTTFGQPVFQAITDILASILAVVNELMVVVEPFAKLIGEQLAANLYNLWQILTGVNAEGGGMGGWAQDAAERFLDISQAILIYLKPALQIILALVNGDFRKAWAIFLDLAKRAIIGVGNFLKTTGKNAFQWGVQFVGMIAKGLITAAKSALRTAVKFVSTMISSFLRPGSPPEEGPLSDIDTWGQGLMETFGEGFKLADLGFMQEALAPIKDELVKTLGTEGYKDVRGNLVEIIKGINETGEINEDLWAQVTDKIGAGNETLKEYLGLQLQLKKANKKVQDATEAGFVSDELLAEAEALEIQLALKKEDLELSKQQADTDKQATPAEQMAEDMGSLADTTAESLDAVEEEIEKSAEEQLAEIAAGIEKEKEILKKKYDSGLITEEEYRKGLLDLQEQYVDSALALGIPAEDEIAKLKAMRDEVEALFGDKSTAETPLDKPADLLASFSEGVTGEFEETMAFLKGEFDSLTGSTWSEVKDTFFSTFTPVWDEIKSSISESLGNIFGTQTGTFGLTDFLSYLLDNALSAINDKWFGPGGLKEFLTTKITDLFDFLGSEEGPLARLGNALNQIAVSLQAWVNDPANQEKIRLLSASIGAVIFDGIKTGVLLSFYGTEKTTPLIQGIANALISIFQSVVEIVKQLMSGIFGEAFASAFTKPVELALDAVWAVLNPMDAFEAIKQGWYDAFSTMFFDIESLYNMFIENARYSFSILLPDAIVNPVFDIVQKVKDAFFDLYRYLVGASVIPDIVNGILEWITKLDVGFISKIESMYNKAIVIFNKLKAKINEVLTASAQVGSNLNPFADNGDAAGPMGWLPGFESGTMYVPQTGPAILHEGEAVLQAPVAELLRTLLGALGGNLNTSFGQSPGSGNSRNVNVNNPVFPNVRTGKDAKGFMDELDRISRLSELRGTV